MLRLAPTSALLLAAVALIAIFPAGCGEAAGSSDSQAYSEVLQGLSDAARSGAGYDAVRHARHLEPAHQAMVEGFCLAIREMVLSREDPKDFAHPYINGRIEARGKMELREMKLNLSPRLIDDAMDELREAIDLGSLSAKLNRNYVKACYR